MGILRNRRRREERESAADARYGSPSRTDAAYGTPSPADAPYGTPSPADARYGTPSPAAVELRGVRRRYGRGAGAVHALRGIDLSLPRGSFTAVMGPSGSGKSTFLQCAAGLDLPTEGSVRLGGTEITGMNENQLTELRRSRLGFVFQAFNLLPSLTVEQNVLLPMRLAGGGSARQGRAHATELLARVGLEGKGHRRPAELSGGQQQRVAIARALVTRPDVIFADEPTGALDATTAAEVLDLLRTAVDSLGATVVMVTHDPVAATHADQVLFLADGLIADRLPRTDATTIAARMRTLATRPALAGAAA
ncbi:ABC transporter ATP-binding protein [Streptomyces sp. NPDC002602]|uniref:ABC transporter ATP-binding protein n=1 Tax=Streptomyces sp. NPDC002602 TaxID=3364654 RepID=UPI0036A70A2D